MKKKAQPPKGLQFHDDSKMKTETPIDLNFHSEPECSYQSEYSEAVINVQPFVTEPHYPNGMDVSDMEQEV